MSVADTYTNMGIVFKELGDYEKALFHYRNALDIQNKSLGRAHVFVAQTIGNIADVYMAQGDLENALLSYKEALDIF